MILIFSDESKEWAIKVVGAISINNSDLVSLETETHKLRLKYLDYSEIKWNELPIDRTGFYEEILSFALSLTSLRFHSNSYSMQQYQHNVQQKLFTSISWKLNEIQNPRTKLFICIDHVNKESAKKVNRLRTNLNENFEKTVKNELIERKDLFYHSLSKVCEIESHVSTALQLTDLFTGCVAYELNRGNGKCMRSKYKDKLLEYLCKLDGDKSLSMNSTALNSFWHYNDCKFQHYNLHLKSSATLSAGII